VQPLPTNKLKISIKFPGNVKPMTLGQLQAWVTIGGGLVAAAGALIASFTAIAEWRRSLEQRKEELNQRQREFRHKQAMFARELTREVFDDPKARSALRMLDWLNAEYEDENGNKHQIRRSELKAALRVTDISFSETQKFIRTRFEALYDYLEQIEQLINLEVITFEDIETVFRYYMVRAIRPEICHVEFLEYYDYPKAKGFLKRFKGKEKALLTVNNESAPNVEKPINPPA
jgi:hypothetical protein